MTTLTIKEIKELATFAGLDVKTNLEIDDMEAEITLMPCPEDGLSDGDDMPKKKYTGSIAYFTEYPDEGCQPLGELVPA